MNPTTQLAAATLASALLHACATPDSRAVATEDPMSAPDAPGNPNFRYRIDAFQVPEASRAEFEAAMSRSLAFLRTLPGFRGHEVYLKSAGPSRFDVVTVATWESQEAVDRAVGQVRAFYGRIGFDPAAAMARWGVKAELGNFQTAPWPDGSVAQRP